MKRKSYFLFWVLITFSCINDSFNMEISEKENENYISFNLGNLSFNTKSVVEANNDYLENYIDFNGNDRKDIFLFFFDADNERCLFFPEQERFTLVDNPISGFKELRIQLIPKEEDQFEEFDQALLLNKNVVIYTVINSGLQREDFINSGVVKSFNQIKNKVVEASFNHVELNKQISKQEKFIMEATEEVYVGGWNNLATLHLKRIASKIQFSVYNLDVEGYIATSAELKMVNFVNKASLGVDEEGLEKYSPLEDDYGISEFIPVPLPENNNTPETAVFTEPFYSYPSQWLEKSDKAAYLLLKVDWNSDKDNLSGYYKIPLSYIPSDTENGTDFRNSLRRNHIYRYYMNITSLGSSDPDIPLDISGNFDILDWNATEPIEVSINKFDWLFVEEQNIVIYPVPGEENGVYYIPYRSSSRLEFAEEPIISYEWFNSNLNDMETKYYQAGDKQYPDIDFDYSMNDQRYIKIVSAVPVNYVPKHISFKVRNNANLFAKVKIIHYPAVYVEAKRSSGVNVSSWTLPGSISQGSNRNLYMITTLALTGDEKFDWGWTTNANLRNKTYSVGDPTNQNGVYVDNADNAWVVSPKFVVQSSLGDASSTISFSSAATRCSRYSEDSYGAGTWRIPTMAELYLIGKLQTDQNSAIQGAMMSALFQRRIWSAGTYLLTGSQPDKDYNAVLHINNRVGQGAVWPYIHVPICVRDIYK